MAKLFHLRPMLWVDDVRVTIDWYIRHLHFSEGNYAEEWQWGVVSKDGIEIMFARPNEHLPYNGASFTGSLYINTDDVDALWERFKGTPFVCYGLENFDYGMREFAIRDCNGYILQFGQELIHEENS